MEIQTNKDEESIIKVRRMSDQASLPERATIESAGIDLKSCEEKKIRSGSMDMVDTGISVEIPKGCYGRIAPRSGLTIKNWIHVGAGVIDRDYRGEVKVVLFNLGNNDFVIKKGDKIAQLICEKICLPKIIEVDILTSTDRGDKGFGSTGDK